MESLAIHRYQEIVESSDTDDGQLTSARAEPDHSVQAVTREFARRFRYIIENMKFWFEHQQVHLGYNESLAAAKKALNPLARRAQARRRVHPNVELMVNIEAKRIADARSGTSAAITGADIRAAAEAASKKLTITRGRPANGLLEFHVQAMMVLYRETFGREISASMTKDSVYQPHIVGPAAQLLLDAFKSVDPAITDTTLANIVDRAHRTGAVADRTFVTMLPLYGGGVEDSRVPTPAPGFQLEHFQQLHPIYSS